MAHLTVDGSDLVLRLTPREKIAGLHANIRVPLASIRSVSVPEYPWQAMRGWRMAGTAVPRIVALGTRRHATGYDFTAMHRGQPGAVQVELASGRFERLLVSVGDPDYARAEAERIAGAAGIRVSEGR